MTRNVLKRKTLLVKIEIVKGLIKQLLQRIQGIHPRNVHRRKELPELRIGEPVQHKHQSEGQEKDEEAKKLVLKSYRKVVKIATILCLVITMCSVLYKQLLLLYLSLKYRSDFSDASAIGIIGGADGPTAIYVSNSNSFPLLSIIFMSLTMIGIIYLHFTKKKSNK